MQNAEKQDSLAQQLVQQPAITLRSFQSSDVKATSAIYAIRSPVQDEGVYLYVGETFVMKRRFERYGCEEGIQPWLDSAYPICRSRSNIFRSKPSSSIKSPSSNASPEHGTSANSPRSRVTPRLASEISQNLASSYEQPST